MRVGSASWVGGGGGVVVGAACGGGEEDGEEEGMGIEGFCLLAAAAAGSFVALAGGGALFVVLAIVVEGARGSSLNPSSDDSLPSSSSPPFLSPFRSLLVAAFPIALESAVPLVSLTPPIRIAPPAVAVLSEILGTCDGRCGLKGSAFRFEAAYTTASLGSLRGGGMRGIVSPSRFPGVEDCVLQCVNRRLGREQTLGNLGGESVSGRGPSTRRSHVSM